MFRLRHFSLCACLLVATCAANEAAAQETPLPATPANPATPAAPLSAARHPWGQFPVGSWKQVRVISETLDSKGNVTNITLTDTKTTLVAVDTKGVSLRVEVIVEVAGKRFASQPQLTKYGYYGEAAGEPIAAKKVGDEEISINGVKIPCETRQTTLDAPPLKRTTVMQYSDAVFPHVLRRETTSTGPDGKQTHTLVETLALEMPQKVLGELKEAAVVRTIRKGQQGTSVTIEVQCEDVPGGVVEHSAQETDETGRVLRRSTLELTDYSIGIGRTDESPQIRRRKRRGR